MAQNLGGHDSKFVQPPPDDLICLICTFVAKDPRQLTCCGKIFCKDCLDGLGAAQPCPHCREGEWESFPDKKSSRIISGLTIGCSKSNEGCDWTGEMRVKDDHMTTCGYELVRCKNDCCDLAGKKVKILRKDLEYHLQEECPNRIIACELCWGQVVGPCHIIEGDHAEKCLKMLVECWNEDCEEIVKRSELEDGTHDKVCEYQVLCCKYWLHGCNKHFDRKDMPKHEEDLKLHLEMALETITDLKKRLDTLEELQLFGATKMDEGTVATFKMEKYQSRMENGKTFYSPPFYTSPGGYKMMVEVQVIERFLSIKLGLVNGENCKNQTWPLAAKIEVQILNQESDDNHLSTLILFKRNVESYEQVLASHMDVIGFGALRCDVENAVLILRGNKKAVAIENLKKRYTVGDTLFLRVIVHKAPKPRPWLICTV